MPHFFYACHCATYDKPIKFFYLVFPLFNPPGFLYNSAMPKNLPEIYHNLYTLLDAGLPILKALDSIEATGKIGLDFKKIREGVAQGNELHEEMAKQNSFAKPDTTMVEIGERSGTLPRIFKDLSRWHSFNREIERKIKSALVLPLAVLLVGSFIAPLPGCFLSETGFSPISYLFDVLTILSVGLGPLIVILIIYKILPSIGSAKYLLDQGMLMIPVVRSAVTNYSLSRFSFAFHIMYTAGIPITTALEKSLEMTPNLVIRNRLSGSAENARQGDDIAAGFSTAIARHFRDLFSVGEQSGKLEQASAKLAELASQRAEMNFETIRQWLPRIIYGWIMVIMTIKILTAYSNLFSRFYNF